MSKANKRILFALVIFIVLVIAFCVLKKNEISVLLNINLNGEKVSIDNAKISCSYEGEKCDYSYTDNTIIINQNKYGDYDMIIRIPKENLSGYEQDVIINLKYIHIDKNKSASNSCELDLVNKNGSISGTYDIELKCGDKYEYNGDAEVESNTINIFWGM